MKLHHEMRAIKLLAVLALAALAGCTQLEKDVGQCEPGVESISGMATVAPAGTGPC
ncbi:hypothetical protein [Thioclava pacifica]|uniref:Lipoprotein n=1 Tax=Thioclava pacifica DSM 10166 TaxID=1353537 RepID=A0A074K3K4_9RHOB|nr:hypothetical protein [Thioclava pacifica]KEO56102.1 hypothetical protein TP2_00855 [Thioclava pacifica DSM 10166]